MALWNGKKLMAHRVNATNSAFVRNCVEDLEKASRKGAKSMN